MQADYSHATGWMHRHIIMMFSQCVGGWHEKMDRTGEREEENEERWS